MSFVRQARAFDERQMGKLLALPVRCSKKLITSHFKFTPGIDAAPVADRKNARVRIVDKLSGFTMLSFKIVMEHGAHVFKIHEKAQLSGVSKAELEELVATARAPGGNVVI